MKYGYSNYSAPLPGYGTSLVDRINLYLHFRRYYRMIADRWLLLVISVSLGTAIGGWVAINKPDQFRATAKLMSAPKMNQGSAMAMFEESISVDAIVEVLRGGTLLNRVQQKLQEGLSSSNKFVFPSVSVGYDKGGVYTLTVVSTNADYAARFATAWADEFIEFKRQQRASTISSSEALITREIIAKEQKLNQATEAFADFKRRNNIVDIRDAGLRAAAKLNDVKNELQSLETEIQIYRSANAEQLATGGVNVKGNPAEVATARPTTTADDDTSNRFTPGSSYTMLRLEQRRLQTDYTNRLQVLKASHPYMEQLRRRITDTETSIAATLEIIDEGRKAQIRALEIKAGKLPAVIEEMTENVQNSTALLGDYSRLETEQQILNDGLTDLRARLSKIATVSSDTDTFDVYQRGIADDLPFGPNRPGIVGTAFGAGLVIGIAVLWLLAKLDDRLESPEQIEEALEEPIMGQLPEVDKRHYKDGYLVLNRMKFHTMFAESLRGVRSTLLLSPEGSSKRFIAVTSAVPGDGKTTFTTNFAITLANSGNRTLLIDADLRRGNINGYFEQPLEGGLAEVLNGKLTPREAIRETNIPNLSFMRAGERPTNPSELLIGPNTKELIRELRAEFDYVIFDCPPLTAIDDTFSIAAYLDGIFFVVRAGKTSIRFAKMAVQTIRQRGAPILGLIVNGVPIDNPYYYYTTYYYASYYHRPIKQDETATLRKAGGPKKVPALPPGMQMPDRAQQPGPMQSLPTTPPEDAPGSGPESGR
jgi:capsular exopolysaccharide synthesis family protein